MTFKEIQKVIESESGDTSQSNQLLLQKLRFKPFWYWNDSFKRKQSDIRYKGACCFYHIISLPKKNGVEYPMFEYENLLYRPY